MMSLFLHHLSAYCIEIDSAHTVLKSGHLQLAPINYCLALGRVAPAEIECFSRCKAIALVAQGAALPCLPPHLSRADSLLHGALFPFGLEFVLDVIRFSLAAL